MRVMKPRKRRPLRRSEAPRSADKTTAARPLSLVGRIAFELVAIAGEMVAIPARAWMRAGERAGAIVLRTAEALWSVLVAAWRLAGRLVARTARIVTPLRAAAAVAVVAAIALGASQFADYRTVHIGTPHYQAVEGVAPAPAVASRDPRSAHGAWLIVIAGASLVVVAASALRRPRLARLLVPLGLGAVAVVVLNDHDAGLQAGRAGIAYEGATPVLLDGYWAELAAAAVVAACGPLLLLNARRREMRSATRTATRRAHRPRRSANPRSRAAGAAG